MEMRIRPALEADLPAILAIYNEVILHTTAVYSYAPHTLEMRRQWFAERQADRWPVIVAEHEGEVVGFGAIGPFRAWPAYKYTGEHSLHVREDLRGKGIGDALLSALIGEARAMPLRTLIGGIDAANAGSIALHAKHGFVECARIRDAGYKFGRWLDLVLVQLILSGPAHPVEE
jgi:L-amino acid N-acyltransferase YncA